MATKKSASTNKKKKGSILPLIVVVIIGFLAYKANPEYWQQGRLFQDLKNGGQKKVETEEIANIPQEPEEPAVDPDAMLPGSIKDAKTIPINVVKALNSQDPTYGMFRSKFKVMYIVGQNSSSTDKLAEDLQAAIKEKDLRNDFAVFRLRYDLKDKRTVCGETEVTSFFCKQCDRRICFVHPKKKEFIVVNPTVSSAIAKAKTIKETGW